MKNLALLYLVFASMGICYGQNWSMIKDTISPTIELTSEYDSLYRQPLSCIGWEDGLHISEDGLHLFCTYAPIDLLSFSLNGGLPNNFSADYMRGAPEFGMDLITNPISATEWLHSDILYSYRATLSDSFTTWQLSNMARPFYSEGAPTPKFHNGVNPIEIMLFTSNDNLTNNTDIWFITNTNSNPSGTGTAMPSPITTTYNEDNPHLVDLQNDTLILFYDSDNLPGGMGDIDLWYSISYDNGLTWYNPTNVSSVNTSSKEHQPFLFYDQNKGKYYLYYSAFHTDNKLAIFRREQLIENDWDSWGSSELVVSAGNSAGIGEPTLTESGDISFVVVYQDPALNSIYNRFDSDPWYVKRKNPILNISTPQPHNKDIVIYPNPSSGIVNINSENNIEVIKIFDSIGILLYETNDNVLDMKDFPNGIYHLFIITDSGLVVNKLLLKK